MAAPKRTGLGRGIGALIPTGPATVEPAGDRPVDVFFTAEDQAALAPVPGARFVELDPNDIVPNRVQPRTEFREEELAELIVSVREFGVLQPIVVRPRPDSAPGEASYELVMGERRLRASKAAGLEKIPAIVRDTADEDMLRDALLENIHRAQLNPLEEASAYQQLLDDFGVTQEQLAERIGRSRSQIANTLRLRQLPESVQRRVAAGVLTMGHAKAILSAGDPAEMERIADKVVREELNVRDTEALASEGAASKRRARPVAGRRQGQLDEIAEALGDRLNTRVKINLTARKGSIVIDFATVGDLNRILGELGQPGFGGN